MPKQRIVHINAMEDGVLVRVPGELIYELGDKIGKIGNNSSKGIGIALAIARESEPHWHETTKEYYFVTRGAGTAHVGNEEVPLKRYDWLEIPLKTVHRVESKRGLDILAITSPPWTRADHHKTIVEKEGG